MLKSIRKMLLSCVHPISVQLSPTSQPCIHTDKRKYSGMATNTFVGSGSGAGVWDTFYLILCN